jgi:DNA primase
MQKKKLRDQVARAKKSLPLPKLMEVFGDEDSVEKSALRPFHDDHRPSFSVFQGEAGKWYWKCHAGCGAGDEISYIEVKHEISRADAIREYLELAGSV